MTNINKRKLNTFLVNLSKKLYYLSYNLRKPELLSIINRCSLACGDARVQTQSPQGKDLHHVLRASLRKILNGNIMLQEIISSLDRFLKNNALRVVAKDYIVFDLEGHLVNPGDRFHMDALEVVDKKKCLVLEKGRYKIVHRVGYELAEDEPMGMHVIDNTLEVYDRFWGDNAISEEYVQKNKSFYEELLNKCKIHLKGRILDAGCGTAGFLELISKKNIMAQLYGLDFSISSMQRSRDLIPGGGFIVCDIYQIAYCNDLFDAVICTETLEHLETPDIALNEIKRVCKKGGTLVITVPNGERDSYIGHLNFWNESSFKEIIGSSGLEEFHYLEDGASMLFVIRN